MRRPRRSPLAAVAFLLAIAPPLGLAAAQGTPPASGAAPPAAQRAARESGRKPAPPAPGPSLDSAATWSQLHWRHIGPEGNRITSIAGVAGDRRTYYAGAASGGMWKTTDGGLHWAPLTDGEPVSSFSALAVAPSDPNVVWAGTGESFIRSHISVGWGIYRSADAGKTWEKRGLEKTGRIARVVVHPTNPDVVLVAALGHAYGPQPERGVFRTTDAGKTWERVLFVNDSTGAIDLVMDPSNPRVLYAATWQVEIHTWGRRSGGKGSAIWKTTDGGTTWTRLTSPGLPTAPVGKIGLAVAKSNPQRVYALIETGDGAEAIGADTARGELFRSDDGGATWQLTSYDRNLAGRTAYYTRMAVAPDNENEAYFLSAAWTKTLDGGRTSIDPPFAETPGGDHHDIWIDPTNADRMIVSHDGGVSISENRGKTWLRQQLPVAQMYHVTLDDRIPYWVYGNRQDGPSARGPSNSRIGVGSGGITRGMWQTVAGGESGWATPDPVDTNIVWSSASGFGSVGGIVTRLDLRTMQAREVAVWPMSSVGWAAESLKYRFVWTFPLTISPHDHNTVYVGSQHVHVTTNGGQTWKELSPDLTRNDKGRQRMSGGLTPDNIGVEYAGVVFAIAESPVTKGVIWAGTNDGRVHVTKDGGATWTDVGTNLAGRPEWGTISNIQASRFDAATAYLSVDGHQVNDREPYIFKTTDYGRTWTRITAGLPTGIPVGYVHVVREDPARRGLLYAGTESGVYVSFDDGARWRPLQANLPHAPVYDVQVQPRFGDLVVATYGRGFWILDDVTPVRTLAEASQEELHLFAPRPTYRFRQVEPPYAMFGEDPSEGTNPPYGASLTYWSRSAAADTARDSVSIDILQGDKVVRSMKGPRRAGLNRVWWNLELERTKEARMRTPPRFAPEVATGPEGRKSETIPRVALLAAPGPYTVRLTAGGRTLTRPITIVKDPNSSGSEADIAQQEQLARGIASDLDSAVATINAVEQVRGQIAAMRGFTGDDSTMKALRAQADSLDRLLQDAEEPLFQTRLTGRGQDDVRYPMQISERLGFLFASVTGGDFAPTDAQLQVAFELRSQLAAARARVNALMSGDVERWRGQMRARKLESIVAR